MVSEGDVLKRYARTSLLGRFQNGSFPLALPGSCWSPCGPSYTDLHYGFADAISRDRSTIGLAAHGQDPRMIKIAFMRPFQVHGFILASAIRATV